MEEVRTCETSGDNYFTRQYMPEDNSEHHTCNFIIKLALLSLTVSYQCVCVDAMIKLALFMVSPSYLGNKVEEKFAGGFDLVFVCILLCF
jgi:hypothetical protein